MLLRMELTITNVISYGLTYNTINNMKNRQKNQSQLLDKFITGILNAKVMTGQLAPLLGADPTAVPTLREIYQQTISDSTQQGRTINNVSQKLLSIHQQISDQFRQAKLKVSIRPLVNQIQRISLEMQNRLKKKKTEKKSHKTQFILPCNDQNVNIINVAHHQYKNQNKISAIDNSFQLCEILRPQYRKSLTPSHIEHNRQKQSKQQKSLTKGGRVFVTESEDSQDIPIVRNRMSHQKTHDKKVKERSISPKHQRKRNIHNISQIGKNPQTQTDVSFQIDLQKMGIVPQKAKSIKQQQNNFYSKKQNHQMEEGDQGIQQQEPWQCDEEQIEQQIRQLNERLSNRGINTHRIKTQFQKSQLPSHRQGKQSQRRIEQHKKQTKTVRLSLTPTKNKSNPKNVSSKRQMQHCQIEIIKTPTKADLQYISKWKKPNINLIHLQVPKTRENR